MQHLTNVIMMQDRVITSVVSEDYGLWITANGANQCFSQ